MAPTLRLRHNVFYGFTSGYSYPNEFGSCNGTAAINIGGQPDRATSRYTTIAKTLIAGGAYSMYCPFNRPAGFRILRNYFSAVYSPKVGAYVPTDGCRRAGISSSGTVRLKYKSGEVLPFRP